ncbi:MAG: ABC transporter ATP-binding protein [Spirochaetaceae bacterium]|nr:ABC transporter ATP-binding protein [Spirochaetaceae bacterium]MCF7949052.1 ABC transporter ATP-binding protein [Spirochaetia bacterium]MCF7951044.1 ABC transporter ATP-binding protein [Spirochaetaceae bacterium]
MGIIELKQVSLSFEEQQILFELSMDFWEGHIHAVVGPNGAGKSTLAHTIMGLPDYRSHTGDILFAGKSIKELSIDERAKLGITLAWQEPARFNGIKVREFIRRAGDKSRGTKSPEEVLNMVGLDPGRYLDRDVDTTLSGGERKRIELASIVAMHPKVVLMDEPDSGVDIDAIQSIFDVLEWLKEHGTTVIMITHSGEVLKHADHAFLLCNGALVDKGTVEQLSSYFERKCVPCTHKNVPDEEALV